MWSEQVPPELARLHGTQRTCAEQIEGVQRRGFEVQDAFDDYVTDVARAMCASTPQDAPSLRRAHLQSIVLRWRAQHEAIQHLVAERRTWHTGGATALCDRIAHRDLDHVLELCAAVDRAFVHLSHVLEQLTAACVPNAPSCEQERVREEAFQMQEALRYLTCHLAMRVAPPPAL